MARLEPQTDAMELELEFGYQGCAEGGLCYMPQTRVMTVELPVATSVDPLDKEAMIAILTAPKNALVKQYKKLFSLEGVELTIREDALRAVAQKAMERKTGARGLSSILEHALLETMYDLPAMTGVKEVVVDTNVITEGAQPLYIYEDEHQLSSGSAKQ